MSRTRTFTAALGAAAVVAGTTLAGGGLASAATPPVTPLAGSVAPFASHMRATGPVPGGLKLTIQVWLRPRLAAAERFAARVSTPGSASFRAYLRPEGYEARFGATAGQAAAVSTWLRSAGFTGVTGGPLRSYVRATGSVSRIDAAFRTQLKLYPASAAANAGPYQLRANATPISIPASLASSVLGVSGLDNAAPRSTLLRPGAPAAARRARPSGQAAAVRTPCSHYYGEHQVSGLLKHDGTGTYPTVLCGYSGTQMRAAYGAAATLTGAGQTIALVELGLTPDMYLTLQDYAKANSLPAPASSRYRALSLGRGSACGDLFDVEEQLDVESSYAMAPGAAQVVVGGDSCNQGDFGLQGLFDADLAVLAGPLATVASNSWESGLEGQPAELTNIEHAYLVQAAAEGVGMYFSSGDGSGVLAPSSDPYAIAVGGTTLGIGKGRTRLFETGWSTGVQVQMGKQWLNFGEDGAAGGGPSLLWTEPSYQDSVVPASMTVVAGDRGGPVRSVPDISADADAFTGFATGLLTFHGKKPPTYGQVAVGGTSLAAPLVAGLVTAAQQGQSKPFGFINPALYSLAGSAAVRDTLPLTSHSPVAYQGVACSASLCGLLLVTQFDDQSQAMAGYNGQVTQPGYDNMTGVGTPAGAALLSGLRSVG
jgi:subtilase family serine protease